MHRVKQQGFSLLEVLVASLLFSMTLLGLMQYQQSLLEQFTHLRHQQQAWRVAQSTLEGYHPTQSVTVRLAALPPGWQGQIQPVPGSDGCQKITVRIFSPQRYEIRLTRWFCRPAWSD